ncbi:hypothetical protein M514_16056 [Trichuris suis]|uniref:Uncharacterized protein n=1 Tax=Trichuris suis TaxID=68888 RepID=A0A085NR50_9BILA|nr:hypothetical protein M514_16056 [Trichuris suis]KHJ43026.1 hypothetical protein D918_06885 [Trichuris suis]
MLNQMFDVSAGKFQEHDAGEKLMSEDDNDNQKKFPHDRPKGMVYTISYKEVGRCNAATLRGGQRGLLVCDSASTHSSEEMKSFLPEGRIDQIMIPTGMTTYLRTLDIAINNPFETIYASK